MALRYKLRSLTTTIRHHSTSPSAVLNPTSTTPLTSKEKSRAALSLLRTETNPERILEICRAASLTPQSHLDRLAFSKAVNKLKAKNYYHGIRTFIEECKERPDNLSERCVSHFIVLYGQAGLLGDAVETFEGLEKLGIERSVLTLNSLLFACVLARDYGEMKRVYVDLSRKYGIMANLETYNTVIKGFCESRQANAVYSVVAEMERKGVKPNGETYGAMIAGFYKEEKFEDVGKVLEMMRKSGVKPGISIYNVRIQSLCKLKRTKEARALLDGILSRGMSPNWVTYGHLVHGFCKEGNLEEAMRTFEEMKQRALVPESDCYFTLVYYLCEGKDFKGALGVYKECMEKKWFPNFSIMRSLVEGLVSISEVDEARQIIGQLKEKFSTNADQWSVIEEGMPK
ncbi:hypothetical protein Leryth_018035 [Lithospermum erythrorhizon]|nr:hypothetical protein Leryth_018035 [Lithospermum erythrorhizon]